ncbi:MAG: ABC transporter substrate-binding protein [Anaerolineae bacterium]
MKKLVVLLLAALALTLIASQCQPQVVEKEVIKEVTKEVIKEVPKEVIKEVPKPVTVVRCAMGYIPSFHYAPFYVALEKGYFAEEGIQLIMDYGTEEDAIKLVAAGAREFGTVQGDQLILARAQGLPIVQIAEWFYSVPIAVFSLAEKGIEKPEDLIGKTVGQPGPYGATYTGYRALLYTQGINPEDINTINIGFTQVAAVAEGSVEAATGWATNEPVELRYQGFDVNVIYVGDYVELGGGGPITNETFMAEHPDVVQGFVRAFVRGLRDTVADPEFALETVMRAVPVTGWGIDYEQYRKKTLEQIKLDNALHEAAKVPLGSVDRSQLEFTLQFMLDAGMVEEAIDIDAAFTNEFFEAAGLD